MVTLTASRLAGASVRVTCTVPIPAPARVSGRLEQPANTPAISTRRHAAQVFTTRWFMAAPRSYGFRVSRGDDGGHAGAMAWSVGGCQDDMAKRPRLVLLKW